MTAVLRPLSLALAAMLGATGANACGDGPDVAGDLREDLQRTALLSHRFAYVDEEVLGHRVEVVGLIEDDLRYKARLLLDGVPVRDEVVNDDAVAALFLEPEKALALALDPGELRSASFAGPPSLETVLNSAPPLLQPQLKALFERRWVVDPVGAPMLLGAVNDQPRQGADPIFDALTVLAYTRNAINDAAEVRRYDEESLEPTYRPEHDRFPKPDREAGVARYDLKEPALPFTGISATDAPRLRPPSAAHFRKMAVYVQRDRIVEVREEIDIERKLKEFARNYRVALPKGRSAAEQVPFAVAKINELNAATTNQPLRARRMVVQLRDFEDPAISVHLPTGNTVEGTLSGVIAHRGRRPGGESP